MSTEAKVHDLITTYLAAWNARDYQGMAALFTEPAVYVMPDGPKHLSNRDALVESLKQQFVVLEANGFDHTEIDRIEVRECTDTTALADMKNVARLRADGTVLEVIDAIYICILQEGQWKMSIAMACRPGWNETSAGTAA